MGRTVAGLATLFLALPIWLQLSLHVVAAGHLHPLIILPGTGNSRIEARLTGAYLPSNRTVCGHNTPVGWFRLWKNAELLREPVVRCFAEQIAVHYDADADDYRNTPGVETVAFNFGSVEGFRRLDPGDAEKQDYSEMALLLERLEAAGYRDGENLFGAPYDFRYGLAADGHPSRVGFQFLRDLKGLIEHAAAANGGRPVVILTHSLGSLFVLHFLNRNPPPWRQSFVKHFIAVAAPWGGAAAEAYVFATGSSVAGLQPSVLRAATRSYESNAWLLPSPRVFGSRPLVVTHRRNYSAVDMPEFLADVGFPESVHPYRSRILPLVDRLVSPGVPVTCISGTGVQTPEVFLYRDGFDAPPEIVSGDGDGTVNMDSLLAAEAEWSGMAEQPLKVIKVPGATHGSILVNEATWKEIMERVSDTESPLPSSAAHGFSPLLRSTLVGTLLPQLSLSLPPFVQSFY